MAKNPNAGVSGPGSYSKRTDIGTPEMKMGSIAYGEGVETAAIQAGAPLAKSEPMAPSEVMQPSAPLTSLYAETQYKDRPVTNGIDMGAGAGSEVINGPKDTDLEFRASIQAAKPVLAFVMDQPNTSPETRAIIKQLWRLT
jgi:hypothetical protein